MEYLNTAKGKFLKFSNLSLKDKLKTVIYSLTFHLFIFAFRLFGYKNSKTVIDKLIIPNNDNRNRSGKLVINESRIISYATGNSFLKSTCLEKSLFSYLILGLYNYKCELKIGINNAADEFSAHAWIEFNNKAINEDFNTLKNFSTF